MIRTTENATTISGSLTAPSLTSLNAGFYPGRWFAVKAKTIVARVTRLIMSRRRQIAPKRATARIADGLQPDHLVAKMRGAWMALAGGVRLPPCPRCGSVDGVEQEKLTGTTLLWYVCRVCHHVWNSAPNPRS